MLISHVCVYAMLLTLLEEDGSTLESLEEQEQEQELDHGDTMVQDVMQNTNATETAPLTDLVGSPNKTGAGIQDEEVETKRKEEKESWKKPKRKIRFVSPVSHFCNSRCFIQYFYTSIRSSSWMSRIQFEILFTDYLHDLNWIAWLHCPSKTKSSFVKMKSDT